MVWGMAAVSAALGLGLYGLMRLLVPSRPSFAVEAARYAQARTYVTEHPASTPGRRTRATAWAVQALRRRGVDLSQFDADLAITGKTWESWAASASGVIALGFFGPVGIGMVAVALGMPVSAKIPIGGGIVLALVAAAASVGDLREEARKRRAEFETSLSSYLDLVAMALQAGRGHPEALPAAASNCQGWAFEMLSTTIDDAVDEGVTPWEAFGRLGKRIGVDELRHLAAALTQVSDDGARVRDTLAARAAALRAKRLAAAGEQAEGRTDSIRRSQLFIAIGFVIWVVYPSMANLFAT